MIELHMTHRPISKLNPKKRYLQVALNSTLEEAHKIIKHLPMNDRIIIEAGTPLIKRYGEQGIRQIRQWYKQHLSSQFLTIVRPSQIQTKDEIFPYVVADLKTMDRGETEIEM